MPEPGDIIRIPRTNYNHYGIYIGNGQLVHRTTNVALRQDEDADRSQEWFRSLSPLSSSSSTSNGKAVIKVDRLDKYTNYVVDNYYDQRYRPLPKEEIVERALSKVDEKGYNVFVQNCEHYVTWCRYGERKTSREVVAKVGQVIINAIAGSTLGLPGAAFGAAIGFVLGLLIPPTAYT